MTDTDAQYSDRANVEFQKHGRLSVGPTDTQIIVVSAKESFRNMARTLPTPEDDVLEIGCSSGEATQQLARTGARVHAVDKSSSCVAKLQDELRGHEQVDVACLDGRNIPGLATLAPNPTIIFIDIGGDAQLDLVALQLRLVMRAFRPHTIVVRSFEMATLSSLVARVEPPQLSGLHPSERPLGVDMLSNLLDLSTSTSSDTRCFAANRLGAIAEEAAHIRLREMLRDPHKQVRRAAERAAQKFASANQDGTNE